MEKLAEKAIDELADLVLYFCIKYVYYEQICKNMLIVHREKYIEIPLKIK